MENNSRSISLDLLRGVGVYILVYIGMLWPVKGVSKYFFHAPAGVNSVYAADYSYLFFPICLGIAVPYALAKVSNIRSTFIKIVKRTVYLSFIGYLMGNMNWYNPQNDLLDKGLYYLLLFTAVTLVFSRPISLLSESWNRSLKALAISSLAILLYLYESKTGNGAVGWLKTSDCGVLGMLAANYFVCSVIYLAHTKFKGAIPISFLTLLAFALVDGSNTFQVYNFIKGLMPPVPVKVWIGSQTLITLLSMMLGMSMRKFGEFSKQNISLFALVSFSTFMLGTLLAPTFGLSKLPSSLPFFLIGGSYIFMTYLVLLPVAKYANKENIIFNYFVMQGNQPLLAYLLQFTTIFLLMVTNATPVLWYGSNYGGWIFMLNHTVNITIFFIALNYVAVKKRWLTMAI